MTAAPEVDVLVVIPVPCDTRTFIRHLARVPRVPVHVAKRRREDGSEELVVTRKEPA